MYGNDCAIVESKNICGAITAPKYPANAQKPKQDDLKLVGAVSKMRQVRAPHPATIPKRPHNDKIVTKVDDASCRPTVPSTTSKLMIKMVPTPMYKVNVFLRPIQLLNQIAAGAPTKSNIPMYSIFKYGFPLKFLALKAIP